MGKGDKKTKRGKVYRGTFGKHRLRKKQNTWVAVPKEKEKVKKEETTEEVKAEVKKEVKKKPGRKKTVKKESE
jgi:30S ribosomal protein S31